MNFKIVHYSQKISKNIFKLRRGTSNSTLFSIAVVIASYNFRQIQTLYLYLETENYLKIKVQAVVLYTDNTIYFSEESLT